MNPRTGMRVRISWLISPSQCFKMDRAPWLLVVVVVGARRCPGAPITTRCSPSTTTEADELFGLGILLAAVDATATFSRRSPRGALGMALGLRTATGLRASDSAARRGGALFVSEALARVCSSMSCFRSPCNYMTSMSANLSHGLSTPATRTRSSQKVRESPRAGPRGRDRGQRQRLSREVTVRARRVAALKPRAVSRETQGHIK